MCLSLICYHLSIGTGCCTDRGRASLRSAFKCAKARRRAVCVHTAWTSALHPCIARLKGTALDSLHTSRTSMHREHDGAESSSAHPQALARDLSTLSIEDPDAIRSKGIPSGRPSSGDTSKSDDTKSGPSAEKISVKVFAEDIFYRRYKDEDDIPVIMALIAPYLSEPYSVYCYRYFLHGW